MTEVPRRVLVVTNDFPTRVGGIETFVLSLCLAMPAEQVVVYTASMPGDEEYDARLPFPVYRDPSRTLLPTRAVARRVAEVMHRHRCDRVLFGSSAPLGLLAASLRRAGAVRLVALTHGHEVWWARVPGPRRLLRRIGDTTDVMTYVSEWCHDHIAPALSPEARGRMRRLSPCVDPERFFPGCGGAGVRRRLGLEPEQPVVVCVGRLVARKGQDTLLRAWPEVLRAYPRAVLLLVGDGPYRRRLVRLAKRVGVETSVVFAGTVRGADVAAYLDAGDVFAMPCRSRLLGLEVEAWGIVFLEAQACGLPVLVGRSGGAPETLLPGWDGYVVDGPLDVAVSLLRVMVEVRSGVQRRRTGLVGETWRDRAGELARLLG